MLAIKTKYRENLESFAFSILSILFIVVFVIQPYIVSGPSMIPTLLDKDRLFVCKFIYWFEETPRRGDIIVLKPPKDTRKYIKRVIGLPGDNIRIKDTKVYINGTEVYEPYINEETLQDYDFMVVPEETVFVMGDNRNCSRDSRDPDVGFIPQKNIVGKVIFIFWPLTRMKILFRPKTRPFDPGKFPSRTSCPSRLRPVLGHRSLSDIHVLRDFVPSWDTGRSQTSMSFATSSHPGT
jgi:signal peptidase I